MNPMGSRQSGSALGWKRPFWLPLLSTSKSSSFSSAMAIRWRPRLPSPPGDTPALTLALPSTTLKSVPGNQILNGYNSIPQQWPRVTALCEAPEVVASRFSSAPLQRRYVAPIPRLCFQTELSAGTVPFFGTLPAKTAFFAGTVPLFGTVPTFGRMGSAVLSSSLPPALAQIPRRCAIGSLANLQPLLHYSHCHRQIFLEGAVFMQIGGIAIGEFGEEFWGHRVCVVCNAVLNMVHLLLGSGVLIHFQFLVEESVGLLDGVSIDLHFTQLYCS